MKRGGAALKNRVASLRLSCSESVDIITTMRIPERPIRPSYNLEFFWEKIQETQWSCSMNTPLRFGRCIHSSESVEEIT